MSTRSTGEALVHGAATDDDESPRISGEYVMDSWRLSQPPAGPLPPGNVAIVDIQPVTSIAPDAPPSGLEIASLGPPPAMQPGMLLPPPSPVRSRTFVAIGTSIEKSIAAFAGFGPPPESIVDCPRYALHVFRRRAILRRELASARDKSSRDITIYEWAIASADRDAMRSGVLLIACSIAFAAFVAILTVGFLT